VSGGFSVHDDSDLPAKWAMEDTSHLDVAHEGGELVELSEPLILYNDRRQAIAKLNKRMMFAVPIVGIYCFCLASLHLYVVAAGLIAWFAAIYLLVVRRFNRNTEPLMQIDASGVTIHGLITHCHVDWDNLKEVRPYTFVYKFVGIDPKSIWRLKASLPTKIFMLSTGMNRALYKLVGTELHLINIPEQYSHFKAEDICEQIEKRRVHFLALPKHSQALPNFDSNLQLPNRDD
jgi:hypothetical protein